MRRVRPSPATVVAFIALVASVTGSAYAAIANGSITNRMLADNSVWHRNIGRGSVRNFNMAGNSVWHAQIGTGSVRLVNIEPATVNQLRSKSAAFANSGPTHLTATGEGVRVAGDRISTTGGENFLVLNGFVIVDSVGNTDDVAVCFYKIDGSIVSATQRAVPGKSEVQIGIIARDPVKAGTHTVDVFCTSTRTIDLIANAAQFTAIATG
ncbi:MAG: hypothetical protein ACTHQQ_15335 [Solirubrobacteraceae bacterium]